MSRMKIFVCLLFMVSFLSVTAQDTTGLVFTIHLDQPVQTIRNIGASGCWFSEEIGARWPEADKRRMAELLFSRGLHPNGQPKGIGLSAFRYNIGAGTAEQGDSSGIRDPAHRVECFLSPDGSYHWNKQKGYTWMLQQAKNYGISDLIAFVNSPPVQFTKNGLGYKSVKDSLANLREDKYSAYGNFLANVIKHFDAAGLHFKWVSPVNEPQWDWTGTPGTAKQEGSPWTNEEIYRVAKALDKSLGDLKLSTNILLTEAGMLDHLYASNLRNRSSQISSFWDPASPLYTGALPHATPYVEGHGYFTETGNNRIINTRKSLRDTLRKYNGLEYWQSEYCMLGDGYREGAGARQKLAPIDYALFLAKIIHHDLAVGNATAWHYWNSFEPGPAASPRYYLIALNPRRTAQPDTLYTVTKNLWALGHYSFFVRPGMIRLETGRNDGLADTAIAQTVMVTAFKDAAAKKVVVNMINYTPESKQTQLLLDALVTPATKWQVSSYVTSAKEGDDIKPYPLSAGPVAGKGVEVSLPARSIVTVVIALK